MTPPSFEPAGTTGETAEPGHGATRETAEPGHGATYETAEPGHGATYAGAGVDLSLGDEAVARIREVVAATAGPEVLGGIGAFAGLFALDTDRYTRPVLVASTDGVGTKMLIAQATGRFGTVGVDLVAMCVDDVVCAGAEPLFLLDYVAVGKLVPERLAEIVGGVAAGCRLAGCALLGGETAEHPGAMKPDDVDLAGFAVGVVERGYELGAHRVLLGDVLVGLPSPGLRSNGYSLARHVLLERAGLPLDGPAWDGAPRSLAEELLEPSVVYAPAVLAALGAEPTGVHACAHVTGGGIPGNLVRVLPPGADARLDRRAWEVPRIFAEIASRGHVPDAEMVRVFNMGLGMVLVVARAAVDPVLHALGGVGVPGAAAPGGAVVGEIVAGSQRVQL
ncbi:MAG: phosphoribosylformylglycinamidine cyclo-ligase [Actinomycetota bacterium]|nr:phosphoribosylformylglycinamidine cyclo-ligase [Actinomycetota bacterium]